MNEIKHFSEMLAFAYFLERIKKQFQLNLNYQVFFQGSVQIIFSHFNPWVSVALPTYHIS